MGRSEAITLTKSLFVGLLLGSLLVGGLALNIILVSILIAIALFILIVAPRADVVYALVGLVIGVAITFFVAGVRFEVSDLTAIALVFLVTWM